MQTEKNALHSLVYASTTERAHNPRNARKYFDPKIRLKIVFRCFKRKCYFQIGKTRRKLFQMAIDKSEPFTSKDRFSSILQNLYLLQNTWVFPAELYDVNRTTSACGFRINIEFIIRSRSDVFLIWPCEWWGKDFREALRDEMREKFIICSYVNDFECVRNIAESNIIKISNAN